jgi:hypothetical protein
MIGAKSARENTASVAAKPTTQQSSTSFIRLDIAFGLQTPV